MSETAQQYQWEDLKSQIKEWYIDENKSANDIVKLLQKLDFDTK